MFYYYFSLLETNALGFICATWFTTKASMWANLTFMVLDWLGIGLVTKHLLVTPFLF
jgi:hypothetical protein